MGNSCVIKFKECYKSKNSNISEFCLDSNINQKPNENKLKKTIILDSKNVNINLKTKNRDRSQSQDLNNQNNLIIQHNPQIPQIHTKIEPSKLPLPNLINPKNKQSDFSSFSNNNKKLTQPNKKNTSDILGYGRYPNLLMNSSLRQIQSLGNSNSNNLISINNDSEENQNTLQNYKKFSKSLFNETNLDAEGLLQESQKKFKLNYLLQKNVIGEINKARSDILAFADLLEKYSRLINKNEKKNFLLSENKKIHFDFNEDKFLECAQYLRELNDKHIKEDKKLDNLIFAEDLKILIPFNGKNKKIVHSGIKDLKEKFRHKYDIKYYLSFRSTMEFEVSIVIQTVKDFCRNNTIDKFFDSEIEFIGINYKNIQDDLLGIYLIFAKGKY